MEDGQDCRGWHCHSHRCRQDQDRRYQGARAKVNDRRACEPEVESRDASQRDHQNSNTREATGGSGRRV